MKNWETAGQGESCFKEETLPWRIPHPSPRYYPQDCGNTTSLSVSGLIRQEASSPLTWVLQQKVRVSVLGCQCVPKASGQARKHALPENPFVHHLPRSAGRILAWINMALRTNTS